MGNHCDTNGALDRLQERLQNPLPLVYGEHMVRRWQEHARHIAVRMVIGKHSKQAAGKRIRITQHTHTHTHAHTTCRWVFRQIYDKGLVYRGWKVMPFSTHCHTPLSNFEAGQNYKEVQDPASGWNFIG